MQLKPHKVRLYRLHVTSCKEILSIDGVDSPSTDCVLVLVPDSTKQINQSMCGCGVDEPFYLATYSAWRILTLSGAQL